MALNQRRYFIYENYHQLMRLAKGNSNYSMQNQEKQVL